MTEELIKKNLFELENIFNQLLMNKKKIEKNL